MIQVISFECMLRIKVLISNMVFLLIGLLLHFLPRISRIITNAAYQYKT
jgi:hypothetical protein